MKTIPEKIVYVKFVCEIAPHAGPQILAPINQSGVGYDHHQPMFLIKNGESTRVSDLFELRKKSAEIIRNCHGCEESCFIRQFSKNQI